MFTIYLHQNIRKARLERKINWKNKQSNNSNSNNSNNKNKSKQKTKKTKNKKIATTEKVIPSKTQPIFPKDFSQVVYLFLPQKSVY